MSKTALILLSLTLLSVLSILLGPDTGSWNAVSKIAAAVFGTFSFFALLVGRRIKFDPVLR